MRRHLFTAALAFATFTALAGFATNSQAADVGVSVSIGQPGFYGRIDIGSFPHPQLIYPQPIVIQPPPVAIGRQPIYLRVPPGHAKNWARYCHRYNACGQPVYFVQDRWYRDVYAPRYRHERHDRRDEYRRDGRRGNGHGKFDNRGQRKGHGRD